VVNASKTPSASWRRRVRLLRRWQTRSLAMQSAEVSPSAVAAVMKC
jgi:hypothetical protein